jgi:Zn-dependent metalloprotease
MIFKTAYLVVAIVTSAARIVLARDVRSSSRDHRILSRAANGKPTFLQGNLGIVQQPHGLIRNRDPKASFNSAAITTLESILDEHVGYDAARQDVKIAKHGQDNKGDSHFRFKESIDGIEVEAASIMMHVSKDGTVYALNGELISTSDVVGKKVKLGCDEAFAIALASSSKYRGVSGEWLTSCELTYVHARDGNVHKAWKRSFKYSDAKEKSPRIDLLYASVVTGNLVVFVPQILDGMNILTRTCNQGTSCLTVVSNSSTPISTGDAAINSAHNFAIGTYNFYFGQYGRDSINNGGMKIISNVHYGVQYNNAFWDGASMTYGDGDGECGNLAWK